MIGTLGRRVPRSPRLIGRAKGHNIKMTLHCPVVTGWPGASIGRIAFSDYFKEYFDSLTNPKPRFVNSGIASITPSAVSPSG